MQNSNEEPVFCLDGASRFDFSQGVVGKRASGACKKKKMIDSFVYYFILSGNCWFLAAISALTFHKSVLGQVVPIEQSFDNYAGIFHFRVRKPGISWII